MKSNSDKIDIKNRDKMYFPGEGISKYDVIEYYENISDYLLPFLKDRPLTLSRFPDGVEEEGFYQKDIPDYFPDWIKITRVNKKEGGTISQVVCNDKKTLSYLVNQGTLSFHPWLSKTSDLEKPNKMVFDLDPPNGNFDLVVEGSQLLRSLLEEKIGLNAFVMTTGSEGMHVVCPVKPTKGFDEVRSFAKQVGEYLAAQRPDAFTTEVRKDKRNDRLFFDYLRNGYGQTSIPPYSLRALKGAPVATPLRWDELEDNDLTSQSYHMKNIFKRLSQIEDPWEQFQQKTTDLDKSFDKLDELRRQES